LPAGRHDADRLGRGVLRHQRELVSGRHDQRAARRCGLLSVAEVRQRPVEPDEDLFPRERVPRASWPIVSARRWPARVRRAALAASHAMERDLRAELGDSAVDELRRGLEELLARYGALEDARAGRSRALW